jgi:hypothetical protein
MLAAGGIGIVSDNQRKADEDNPRGYYEEERVKRMKHDAAWLDECRGKVVKVISMLLFDLPPGRDYKIIFMRRAMDEILASQKVMLQRRGENEDNIPDQEMALKFAKHMRQVEEWLGKQDNMAVLYVNYNDIINDTKNGVECINKFLGNQLNEKAMVKTVEHSLYRQRKTA